MRSRLWLTPLLLTLLVGLCPVAYASPIDQTWLDGLSDDADFDDVIRLLTSDDGISDGLCHALARATAGFAWVAAPTSGLTAGVSHAPYHFRAPPLA